MKLKWQEYKRAGGGADYEVMINGAQLRSLVKGLKLPKDMETVYGGRQTITKKLNSKGDSITVDAEGNNQYRVTASSEMVKSLVNKSLGLTESSIKNFTDYIEDSFWKEQGLDEVMTAGERIKRKQSFKKNKAKIMRGRKLAAKKKASPEKLKQRAMKQARAAFEKKLTAGKSKSDMSMADRGNLEKRLEKKSGAIKKLARKLLPKVRAADVHKNDKKTNEAKESLLYRLREGTKPPFEVVGDDLEAWKKSIEKAYGKKGIEWAEGEGRIIMQAYKNDVLLSQLKSAKPVKKKRASKTSMRLRQPVYD